MKDKSKKEYKVRLNPEFFSPSSGFPTNKFMVTLKDDGFYYINDVSYPKESLIFVDPSDENDRTPRVRVRIKPEFGKIHTELYEKINRDYIFDVDDSSVYQIYVDDEENNIPKDHFDILEYIDNIEEEGDRIEPNPNCESLDDLEPVEEEKDRLRPNPEYGEHLDDTEAEEPTGEEEPAPMRFETEEELKELKKSNQILSSNLEEIYGQKIYYEAKAETLEKLVDKLIDAIKC